MRRYATILIKIVIPIMNVLKIISLSMNMTAKSAKAIPIRRGDLFCVSLYAHIPRKKIVQNNKK